jgi:hypothetical protein
MMTGIALCAMTVIGIITTFVMTTKRISVQTFAIIQLFTFSVGILIGGVVSPILTFKRDSIGIAELIRRLHTLSTSVAMPASGRHFPTLATTDVGRT